MRQLWMTVVLVSFCLWIPRVLAQTQDPTKYLNQANSEIQTANRLFEQTRRLLEGNPSRGNMETAVSLLIEAGKLFEHAGSLYKSLGTDYATEEDVENSFKAMQRCVQGIEEIKARLNEG